MVLLIGMRSPIFQPKRLARSCADDRALAVLQEVSPLVVGNDEFRKNLALVFGIDDELREEIFLVLIDAAEPVIVGDRDLDARGCAGFCRGKMSGSG